MLLLVLASCRAGAPKIPVEGSYLTEIRIEGTEAIDVDDIAPGLAIDRARRGTTLRSVDAYLLTVDIERVRAAYLKLGYFDVKVTARVDLKGREQTVVFVVVEGTRSTVKVEISGLPPEIPLVKARALVAIADGEPFDYLKYDLAKLPMVKLVEDAGYANVDVEAVVLADRANRTATVRFATRGHPARAGPAMPARPLQRPKNGPWMRPSILSPITRPKGRRPPTGRQTRKLRRLGRNRRRRRTQRRRRSRRGSPN